MILLIPKMLNLFTSLRNCIIIKHSSITFFLYFIIIQSAFNISKAENIYFYLRGTKYSQHCHDIECKFMKTLDTVVQTAQKTDTFNKTNTTNTANFPLPENPNNKTYFKSKEYHKKIKSNKKRESIIKHLTNQTIAYTPTNIVINQKSNHSHKKRSSHSKKSSKKKNSVNNPLELTFQNHTLKNLKVLNNRIKVTKSPKKSSHSKKNNSHPFYESVTKKSHHRKHSNPETTSIYVVNNIDKEKTFTDPKNQGNSTSKQKVEEHSYSVGCVKVILTSFLALNQLQIAVQDQHLGARAMRGNAGIMANYLDRLVAAPLGNIVDDHDVTYPSNATPTKKDIEEVRHILLNIPSKKRLSSALNLIHPAKISDLDLILCNNHSLIYSNIGRHFKEYGCSYKPENTYNVWGKAFGNFQNVRSMNSITGYKANTGGIFVGIDHSSRDWLYLGAGFAFTLDNVRWNNTEADALLNTYYGFLYSSLTYEMASLEAIGSLSYTNIDGNRYIRASKALQRITNSESSAMTYSSRLKGSYNFNLPYNIRLQLFDTVDLGNVYNKRFREHGAFALNLHVNKRNSIHLRNEIGFQLSKNYFSQDQTTCWTPALALKWIYQNPLSDNNITASFQHQSSHFTVKTRHTSTNQISPEISLTANSSDGLYLSAYYEGAFGNKWHSNELGIHIGKSF